MDCSDLTESEHAALISLTKSANRRTRIVRSVDPKLQQVDIDALVEMGFVNKIAEQTLRVEKSCRGHRPSPAVLPESQIFPRESLTESTTKSITANAVVPPDTISRSSSENGLPDTQSSDHSTIGHVRFVPKRPKGRTWPGTLAREFDIASRMHHWACRLSPRGRAILHTTFKRWMEEGATPEDILWMIRYFFTVDMPSSAIKGDLSRIFVSRLDVLKNALDRVKQAEEMERYFNDPPDDTGKRP